MKIIHRTSDELDGLKNDIRDLKKGFKIIVTAQDKAHLTVEYFP